MSTVHWNSKKKIMGTAVGAGRDPQRKVRLWEELESCAPDSHLTKTSSYRAVLRLWVCFPSRLSDNGIPHLHVHTVSEPIHQIRHHPCVTATKPDLSRRAHKARYRSGPKCAHQDQTNCDPLSKPGPSSAFINSLTGNLPCSLVLSMSDHVPQTE